MAVETIVGAQMMSDRRACDAYHLAGAGTVDLAATGKLCTAMKERRRSFGACVFEAHAASAALGLHIATCGPYSSATSCD